MKSVDTLPAAISLINDFLIDRVAPIPDDVKVALRDVLSQNSPGPIAARLLLELIYARRDELPVELLQIGVQITNLMTVYQQLGYQNGRGEAISKTLLAMPGVIVATAGAVEAPKPDPQYVKPEATPAPATPPAS